MKRTLVLLAAMSVAGTDAKAQAKEELKPYVEFLESQKPAAAKDYIVSLFETNDLVILCERDHRDVTQYDLILDVMRDPYFVENVGIVFTEMGAQNLNPALNEFLRDGGLSANEVERQALQFQRDAMDPLWDKTNFMYFIKGIHDINKGLPAEKKLDMYPTNPLYIEGEPTQEKFDEMMVDYMRYDYLEARYIVDNFDRMKRENPAAKALVIMNYRHAYNFIDEKIRDINTGYLLFNLYMPGRVANVLINSYSSNNWLPYQDGRWDAAFKTAGIENAGFDFADSPFGADGFDHWVHNRGDRSYRDVFNGFVYYLPFEKFETWVGYEGLLDDAAAERIIKCEKFLRRAMAKIQARPYPEEPDRSVEEYKQHFNTLQKGKLWNLPQLEEAINRWIK